MGSPKQPATIMGQEVLSGLSKEALVKVLPHFLAKTVTSGTESMGLSKYGSETCQFLTQVSQPVGGTEFLTHYFEGVLAQALGMAYK